MGEEGELWTEREFYGRKMKKEKKQERINFYYSTSAQSALISKSSLIYFTSVQLNT